MATSDPAIHRRSTKTTCCRDPSDKPAVVALRASGVAAPADFIVVLRYLWPVIVRVCEDTVYRVRGSSHMLSAPGILHGVGRICGKGFNGDH